MKKTFYYAATTIDENGKQCHFCMSIKGNENIVSFVNSYGPRVQLKALFPCENKKQALDMVSLWTECSKQNGTLSIF